MANVDLTGRPRGVVPKMAARFTRRRFGRPIEPVLAASHHAGVLAGMGAVELAAERSWRRIDPHLRWLVVQVSAAAIGCSWCTDFGTAEGVHMGVEVDKIRHLRDWRSSAVYDERDRAVIEFAEAATATPVRISDELVSVLRRYFDDRQMVELAAWVALENSRSRFNAALGLESQGFSDRCGLAPAGVAT